MLAVELVEGPGIPESDVAPSDVFVDHPSVFGLCQAVVVGMARLRLGLFDQQLV